MTKLLFDHIMNALMRHPIKDYMIVPVLRKYVQTQINESKQRGRIKEEARETEKEGRK